MGRRNRRKSRGKLDEKNWKKTRLETIGEAAGLQWPEWLMMKMMMMTLLFYFSTFVL